jgi:hypothetical protein
VHHGKRAQSHLPRTHSSFVHALNTTQANSTLHNRSNRYHGHHNHEHANGCTSKLNKNQLPVVSLTESYGSNRASNQRVFNEPFCELHNPIKKKASKNHRNDGKQTRGKKQVNYEHEDHDETSAKSDELTRTQQDVANFKHSVNSNANRASTSLGLLANMANDSHVYPNDLIALPKQQYVDESLSPFKNSLKPPAKKERKLPNERQPRHQRSLSMNPCDNVQNFNRLANDGLPNGAKNRLSQMLAHESSYEMCDWQKMPSMPTAQPFSIFSQLKVSNVDMPRPVYPYPDSFLNSFEHKDEPRRNGEPDESLESDEREQEIDKEDEEQVHDLEELDDEGNYYLLKKRHSSKGSSKSKQSSEQAK